ncbi:MAG: SpaH/EbpB family LPXTG-anchored major pilin [Ruminococcus sp.]
MRKFTKLLSIFLIALMAISIFTVSFNAVSTNLIDSTKTGSLTIHKYEMPDISVATSAGTGDVTDEANVPSTAKPYAGVKFKVSRIVNLKNSDGTLNTTYYTPAGVELPTVSEATAMTSLGTMYGTTDSNGLATLSNLPLGIYLVQEVEAPAQTNKKTPAFVVSIPMTKVNGTEWEYNVNVYPKNETKYAEITLKKTDYVTGEVLQGAEFKVIKSADAVTWTDVEEGLVTGADGKVKINTPLDANTYYRVIETKAPDGYILVTGNKSSFYINSVGEVCDPGTKQVIDVNNPQQFTITNTKPSISKKVNSVTSKPVFANDVNTYNITVTTPNVDMTKMHTFKVTDTLPNGIIFNTTNTADIIKNVKIGTTALTAGTDYTATLNGNNKVTVKFLTTSGNFASNKTITFDIASTTTDYTAISGLLGTDLDNTAQLTYSLVTETTDDTDTTETITSEKATVFTGGYKFKKVDSQGNALAGVEFKVYKTRNDADNGTNAVSALNSSNAEVSTFVSDSNGYVTINGLLYGENNQSAETATATSYWVVETKTKDGYNLLAEPFEISVDNDSHQYANTQLNVVNSEKTTLPLTGGQNTIIITICGILSLFAGALILFVVYKSKKKQKNNG